MYPNHKQLIPADEDTHYHLMSRRCSRQRTALSPMSTREAGSHCFRESSPSSTARGEQHTGAETEALIRPVHDRPRASASAASLACPRRLLPVDLLTDLLPTTAAPLFAAILLCMNCTVTFSPLGPGPPSPLPGSRSSMAASPGDLFSRVHSCCLSALIPHPQTPEPSVKPSGHRSLARGYQGQLIISSLKVMVPGTWDTAFNQTSQKPQARSPSESAGLEQQHCFKLGEGEVLVQGVFLDANSSPRYAGRLRGGG
ncbi:hypothetical protein H920_01052 [Fukomys damarensis]|uniref:Uncharacterized protein n=1 Tax=Fukomys damarensis TaxID=885580 RepID=A0A091E2J7_FUKDA|nr:hypothetical protein H920_01052 [Fukomys damarensis]